MKNEWNRGRTIRLVLWCLVIVAVALIVMLKVRKPPPPILAENQEKPVAVATRIVEAQSVPDSLSLPGRVEAVADITLSVEKAGRIQLLPVDKGDRVKRGDMLLQLDDRVWRAVLKRAEIELSDAGREESRWLKLKGTGAVSDSEYDHIRRRLDVAAVAVEEARVHVEQCSVVSPIDGVIDERPVDIGEYVTEGQAVFRVINADRIQVVVNLPDKEVVHVKPGLAMQFQVPVIEGASFTGTVSFVSSAALPQQSCFATELLVDNPDPRILPGMLVNVSVVRREWNDAIIVPINTVVPKKGHHFVFLVRGERVAAQVVKIERFLGDSVVVSSGLKEGDEIVVEGQRTLQDGTLVTVLGR